MCPSAARVNDGAEGGVSYTGQLLVRLSVQSSGVDVDTTGAAVMAALQATAPHRVIPFGHHDEASLGAHSALGEFIISRDQLAGMPPFFYPLQHALSAL